MSSPSTNAFPLTPAPGWHEGYLGVPYRWDGRTPDAWDCWGLCRYCWAAHFGRADLPDFHEVTTFEAGQDRASRFAAQEAAIRAGLRELGSNLQGSQGRPPARSVRRACEPPSEDRLSGCEGELAKPAWRKLARPITGAGVLFLIGGRPLHVGLYLGQGDFLHCDRSTATTVEALSDPEWRDRVEGFYVPA